MHLLLFSRVVFRRAWSVGFCAVCWSAFMLSAARAYVLEGFHWPDNQTIELDLQLGSPQGTLIDGSASWDQVVQAATGIWNPSLGSGVQFVTQETSFTPAQRDGKNSVFFSTSVFGEGFGDDTLATTVSYYNPNTGVAAEADVVFNVAQSFNSYRGPLRGNGTAQVFDLRRITLHELGHVLGLDHVAQSTQAIMTPDTTDIDTIQADDIAGVESLYGNPAPVPPVINEGLSDGGLIGQDFLYRISANNQPTSYQASGLPAGLSLDSGSGLISGIPTVAGDYDVVIGAVNSAGTGTAILHLVFGETLQITGNLNLSAYVGRPYYYQITTTGQPTRFQPINGPIPAGLSLNQQTGLISGTPTTAGDFRFQVEVTGPVGDDEEIFELVVANDATLSVVQSVDEVSALLRAKDGNLYGTTSYGSDVIGGVLFQLTPDGTRTDIYKFDHLTGPFAPNDLHQAADGSFYGTTKNGGANYAGTVFKVTADGTMATLASFPRDASGSPTVLLAGDGSYYSTTRPGIFGVTNPGGWIYKLTPDGTLTTLHTFNVSDGFYPSALIQATDGNFYGTTYQGGSSNLGTVFKITPDGTLTTLHNFTSAEGVLPLTSLLQANDGNFYGTTSAGGVGKGTVFKMTADGGVLTTIHTFVAGEGNSPTAALVQDSDGNFYGSASGYYVGLTGGGPNSILFKVTLDGTLTTLHTFASNESSPTSLPLLPDGAGNFFGVGGGSVGGTIFKETPSAVPLVYAPPPMVLPTVTLDAAIPQVAVGSGGVAEFMVGLSTVQDHDVTVSYTIKGSAANGTDYMQLKGTKKIKAGKLSKPIQVIPQGDLGGASKKTVVLTLAPGDGYTIDTTGKVKVKIVSSQ